MIQELIDNKVHVFSEKPLTLDAGVSHQLAEKAEKAGLVHQVGFPQSFHRNVH